MYYLSRLSNEKQLILIDGALTPGANNILDLGASDNEFKNAYFDGTVTSDAFAGPLTGEVTGNASTATALAAAGTIASSGDVVWTVDFSGANVTFAGTIGSGAVTSTGIVTGTGFTAGSAVLAEAELELLDGLTAGTAIASKVVTTD